MLKIDEIYVFNNITTVRVMSRTRSDIWCETKYLFKVLSSSVGDSVVLELLVPDSISDQIYGSFKLKSKLRVKLLSKKRVNNAKKR